jgi:2'-phosphotransferase
MGLTVSPDGYVPVDEVLGCQGRHPKFRRKPSAARQQPVPACWTVQDVRDVVETSDKRRFKLEERRASEFYPDRSQNDDDTNDQLILCIRANQGHSISGIIDSNQLLTQLSSDELTSVAFAPMIVHGTYEAAWNDNIRTHGLMCMSRNHIHFATGLPPPRRKRDGRNEAGADAATENHDTINEPIISGMRRSCQVYIYVDASKCARDGVVFYRSDNGVLLTSGVGGILPVQYFSHVTTASGTVLLDNRDHQGQRITSMRT